MPVDPAVVAVVPLYSPPPTAAAGITALAAQTRAVVLVDDGSPVDVSAFVEGLALPNVHLLRSPENLGIAHALNLGVDAALHEHGAEWVLTSDQDSVPAADYVDRALRAAARLAEAGVAVTAIAAGTVGDKMTRSTAFGHPPFGSTRETIQSGMLFPAESLRTLGPFDESFFIDCVDTDYILRGATAGRPTVVVPECRLDHALGDGIAVRLPFFFRDRDRRVPYHGPVRRYYITRNRTRLVRRHARAQPAWALRQCYEQAQSAAADLVYGPQKADQLRAAVVGLVDGLRGRGGRIAPALETRLRRPAAAAALRVEAGAGR
jgi:rhamnosyltransferase